MRKRAALDGRSTPEFQSDRATPLPRSLRLAISSYQAKRLHAGLLGSPLKFSREVACLRAQPPPANAVPAQPAGVPLQENQERRCIRKALIIFVVGRWSLVLGRSPLAVDLRPSRRSKHSSHANCLRLKNCCGRLRRFTFQTRPHHLHFYLHAFQNLCMRGFP